MDPRYAKRIARYWQKQESFCLTALLALDAGNAFNFWKTHPDIRGKGNRCPENRAEAAALGYRLLQRAETVLAGRKEPAQCWAIFGEDSAEDAVFIHSANPNTPYPFEFTDVVWGCKDCEYLNAVVDSSRYKIGSQQHEGRTLYTVAPLGSIAGGSSEAA